MPRCMPISYEKSGYIITYTIKVGFLSTLKLLLQEKDHLFNVTTRGHIQHDTDSFSPHVHIRAACRSEMRFCAPAECGATHAVRIWRISMMRASTMAPCFDRRVSMRSKTINFTLLSDSLTTKLMKEEAAAAICYKILSTYTLGELEEMNL